LLFRIKRIKCSHETRISQTTFNTPWAALR
jgi:hypothetical protein